MKPHPVSHSSRPEAKRIHLGLAILLALACPAGTPQQANQPPQYMEKSYPVAAGNEWPDKNAQSQMRQREVAKKNFEAANLERKRQIDIDSGELVQLAREVKSAVEKAGKNTLSLDIVRKAELIEKLAHGVKEKMKLTVTGS